MVKTLPKCYKVSLASFHCTIEQTFHYNSPYWTDHNGYGVPEGETDLDRGEAKLATYWNTPFTKICLAWRPVKKDQGSLFWTKQLARSLFWLGMVTLSSTPPHWDVTNGKSWTLLIQFILTSKVLASGGWYWRNISFYKLQHSFSEYWQFRVFPHYPASFVSISVTTWRRRTEFELMLELMILRLP